MEYRRLGASGLKASILCLGAMMFGERTNRDVAARIVDSALKAHADRRGVTAGQWALNWVLNNKLVTAVIAGPRTEEQWRDYLGALDYRFDADDEALVDKLVAPGRMSTPAYTDPKFPILGRVPRT